ncbi:hypothetical protein LUZ60_012017 [Juncus effusus]|nr:hypothetical protein LUZ60_012017 [Juncus effusus]
MYNFISSSLNNSNTMNSLFSINQSMEHRIYLSILIAFNLYIILGISAQGIMVPALYVFGDSQVDVGNNNYLDLSLLKANFPHNGVDYPGHKPTGRFSNGFNFADFLAQNIGLESPPPYLSLLPESNNTSIYLSGVSFASAGAGIYNSTNEGECISFDEQIEYLATVYASLTQQIGATQTINHLSKSIFAVVIGSNELINYAKSDSINEVASEQFVDSLILTLQAQLKRIYDLSAREFVFIGVGPVGCVPALRERNQTKECNAEGNYISALYNKKASSLLEEMRMQHNDMSYSFLDTSSVVFQYINNPSAYGFEEVAEACCGLGGDLNAKIGCLPVSTYCANRSNHLFWDFYHPTETTAQMIASTAFDGSAPFVYPINIRHLATL